ncbi:MAG: preprotein translocase subunit SecG [Gemmatimonadaceae bacterium]
MFYNFLLVILVIDAIVLVASILLQAGKGSGLAASFGGASSSPDAFIGIRQAGTLLTKAAWWCGGIFLTLAFVLQIMSTRARAPRSILEDTFSNPPAGAAPAPLSTPPASPAVPLEPAPGAAPRTIPPPPAATAPATRPPASIPPAGAPATTPPPPPSQR